MHQNGNPGAVSPARGAGRNAQQYFSLNAAKNKARPAGGESRPTASLQIEIVHHCTAAGVQTWHIVLTENASRKSVAAFASKGEAIQQLGFFSEQLRARIVGRGSAVTR